MQLTLQTTLTEAGCDEAGRGCLAGAVFAAAVILPATFNPKWVNDSKLLTEKQRTEKRLIIEQEAVAWAVAAVLPDEIDRINILNAAITAMHRALKQLQPQPQFLAIDGNRFKPYATLAHQCVIKGDSLYAHIAAASIVAKTSRDAYMLQLHEQYPMYQWHQNKGYPTLQHRQAIARYGPCPHHRLSFRLLPHAAQTQLFENG